MPISDAYDVVVIGAGAGGMTAAAVAAVEGLSVLLIERAPFYALRIYPADLGTAVGLRTDADARVLNTNGVPIVGLYACGNDMGSIMNGNYPGPGITLGPALTFGYIAGRHLAQTASEAPARQRGQA